MTIVGHPTDEVWRIDKEFKIPLLEALCELDYDLFPCSSHQDPRVLLCGQHQMVTRTSRPSSGHHRVLLGPGLPVEGDEEDPLRSHFWEARYPEDSGNPAHPDSGTNQFCLGLRVVADTIILPRPDSAVLPPEAGMHEPLLGPLGMGYRSTLYLVPYGEEVYQVTFTPRAIEALQAITKKPRSAAPKTISALKRKGKKRIKKLLKGLDEFGPEGMGGFRVDVTLTAKTLRAAV
ncbi:unnamed protein product [Tilletia controversa]|nr:unnamed protein product [Tilletia controversa]CAD6980447.1 unnamed protein product [Tilletia controversa]